MYLYFTVCLNGNMSINQNQHIRLNMQMEHQRSKEQRKITARAVLDLQTIYYWTHVHFFLTNPDVKYLSPSSNQ